MALHGKEQHAMVAVTTDWGGTAHLPYLVPGRRRKRRLHRLVRLLRLALFLTVAVLALRVASEGQHASTAPAGLDDPPLGVVEPVRAARAAPVPTVHVVQPGETLWSIARELQPSGDVRPLVHKLSAARRGAPLRAGERLVIPT